MKVKAEYVAGVGHIIRKDGVVIWSDDWAVHSPEDVTVTRDIGALLRAVGVEVEVEGIKW